jgi:hypothetical protein
MRGSWCSLRPAGRAGRRRRRGVAAVIAAAALSPMMARGLRTLVHRPSLFEGAAISAVPLVGDVRITYHYPAYTGLPRAPSTDRPATSPRSRARAFASRRTRCAPRAARCCCSARSGEKGEIAASLSDNALTAELTLNEDATYRFWLQPALGRAVREARSHHLTVEADAAPRVDILGPRRQAGAGDAAADRDRLFGHRRLRCRHPSSWSSARAIVPNSAFCSRDGGGARTVQGRTLWDPASVGLGNAERIAYRIEARDRDDVSPVPAGGIGKSGTSRTLYVIIQNPHESLEDRLERQRELLEKFIGDLAQRLERGAIEDPAAAIAQYVSMHDAEESHLGLLGQLIDEDRRNPTLGKALRAPLAGIADPPGASSARRREGRWRRSRGKATAGGPPRRLDAMSGKHVASWRTTCFLLDDLIGRQRLEDLAALGKELTDAHQRPARSARALPEDEGSGAAPPAGTRSARAARAPRRARPEDRRRQGAQRRPEEWRNMPDLKNVAEQARKLDEMLEKGNDRDLEKALAELGNDPRGPAQDARSERRRLRPPSGSPRRTASSPI